MTAPALNVYVNGQGQVSADNLNTFMQTCNIVSDLRGFQGVPGIAVELRGFSAIGDGGQGFFYWNSGSTAPDDGGATTIVPSSSIAGAWTRLSQVSVDPYTLIAPITGFIVTIGTGINQLLLNPSGVLANGTVTMPLVALDGQIIKISTQQTITSITISPNTGQNIIGAPTTLVVGSPAVFLYNLVNRVWYRT